MNVSRKFSNWLDARKAPVWMDVIRVFLGVFLFYKGFVFTMNFESLHVIAASISWIFISIPLAHYVSIVHLAGGALLALGAYTRSMCLLNIPILMGAVLINYERFLTVDDHMELTAAITVVVLLGLFFVYGGGRFSLDELRRRENQRKAKSETNLHFS